MGGGRAIRVRLLGGLAIEGIDHNALGSRKARLLLKRLAIARGATVASDELVDVLWGDSPPHRPHDQLGVLVSRLRRVLGAAAIPHRDSGYALVADWLDVDELARRVDEASAASAQGRMAAAKASADAAIAIGRGALLPDDEGAWIDGERAWCAANVARAHHIAAEAALASGDVDTAAATSEAALRTDPFDETALARADAGPWRGGAAGVGARRVRARPRPAGRGARCQPHAGDRGDPRRARAGPARIATGGTIGPERARDRGPRRGAVDPRPRARTRPSRRVGRGRHTRRSGDREVGAARGVACVDRNVGDRDRLRLRSARVAIFRCSH